MAKISQLEIHPFQRHVVTEKQFIFCIDGVTKVILGVRLALKLTRHDSNRIIEVPNEKSGKHNVNDGAQTNRLQGV